MQVFISSAILAEIQQLVLDNAPQEICGILLGRDGRVNSYRIARNVAADPVRHFEIDPATLIAAERASRDGGDPILGYYHSHPAGTFQDRCRKRRAGRSAMADFERARCGSMAHGG